MNWNRDGKKKELWEQNKTTWQRIKIEISIKWRRFMTQTHGLGLIIVLILISMTLGAFLPIIMATIIEEIDKTKYKDALIAGCKDTTFYAWNFKSCENIGARPQ